MKTVIEGLLKASPYFAALSDAGRQVLARSCVRRELARRETLFLEGRRGDTIYLLESGEIQLLKAPAVPDRPDVVIRSVRPGELFAEVMLFESSGYPVSAVAVKKSAVHGLPRTAFRNLLGDPDFRDEFMGGLMRRMRYLTERILYLTAYDVEERFVRFLEEQDGRRERYTLSLSKKDVASAIGATPETLSRLLMRWKSAGVLKLVGRQLTLSPGFWADR